MYLDDRQKLMFYMHCSGLELGVIGCISDKRQGWHAAGCWQQGRVIMTQALHCATLDTSNAKQYNNAESKPTGTTHCATGGICLTLVMLNNTGWL